MNLESGQHRVMRMSSSKRTKKETMYTFLINVTVTPIVETSPIQIPNEHLKIESLRGTGKGGMKINSANLKAQITHLPSGITVQHFEAGNRDFKINQRIAMKKLYGRLEELEKERAREEVRGLTKIKNDNSF